MGKRGSGPSPAIIVASLALVAALAGTAIAGPDAIISALTRSKVKKIAQKQVNKRFPVGESDIANGAVTREKTSLRWALVGSNGSILAQTGGISVVAHNTAGTYLDFGSSLAGRSIQATSVYRSTDPDGNVIITVSLCDSGALGADCTPTTPNDSAHVFVAHTTGGDVANAQAFYITVF
jgi:hypothetical protein